MTIPAGLPRDRDQAGRPRNARPRDALGRPLDHGAAGEQTLPDTVTLAPTAALALAQRLLDDGRPFQAHEVLEAAWRTAPPGERELWRGLAQIAVGLTHAQRGNSRGAVALLRRGSQAACGFTGSPRHGIDPAAIGRSAADLASSIERAGLATITPADLRLRLQGPAQSQRPVETEEVAPAPKLASE